jgi:hypothetical protein
MIRVRYTPQVGLPGHRIVYTWQGRILTAALYRGEEEVGQEVVDLLALQPGDEVEGVEPEVLAFSPLVSARCANDGTLEVVLLHWYEGGEEPKLAEEVIEEVADG